MKGSVPISCDTRYPPGHCYWSGSGICCLSLFLGSPDRRTGTIIHLFAKVLQILYILPKGRTTFAEWVTAINTRQATLWTLSPHFCWKLHQVNHSETPLVLWFVQSSGGGGRWNTFGKIQALDAERAEGGRIPAVPLLTAAVSIS